MPRTERIRRLSIDLTAVLALAVLLGSCGEDEVLAPPTDDPLPTSQRIVFERHRDPRSGAGVPVLTESGSGFDAREVDSPAVVFDAARDDSYLLYYEANDGGSVSRIGLVTSASPELSTRTIDRREVLGEGPVGSGYEAGATDPSVVVQEVGPRYRMWFEGRSGSGGGSSTIITAVSPDGISWTDARRCSGLAPSYANGRVADPCVVFDGSVYRMWFEAQGSGLGLGAVGYAESQDGIEWTVRDAAGRTGVEAQPVLGPRGGVAFDAVGVHAPSVTVDPSSPWRWQMWYEASDLAASTQSTIGVAVSEDGLNWTRFDRPVLAPASDAISPLPFDSGDLEHPVVIVDDTVAPDVRGHFLLWYTGDGEGNSSPNRVGLARGLLIPEEAVSR